MASVISNLLISLLLLPISIVVAQTNIGIIKVGETLTAGDDAAWWLSPYKDFAFGFRPLKNDHFLLAIWYYKLTEVTTVWYANGNYPAPRGSQVELTSDLGLVLTNPQGDKMIWRSEFEGNISTKVRYGLMKDSGNFVLLDGKSSTPIWESFKNPTDTLLPTQIMELGGMLTSRINWTDYSTGRFQFQLLKTGNAVLDIMSFNYKFYPTFDNYYESRTTDPENKTNSAGYRVIFDESGYLYVLRRNNETVYIISPEDSVLTSKFYVRATINFHGVFTLSYHPKNSSLHDAKWKIKKAIPDNICIDLIVTGFGSGLCGYNSICKLKDDGTPSCKCPTGYSLVDSDDEYSGCKPDFSMFCHGGKPSPGLEMAEIQRTDWPQSDFGLIEDCHEPVDCKNSCLLDCFCEVASYNYEWNTCWKKKLPLPNGRESTQINGVSFVKFFSNSTIPSRQVSEKKKETTLIVVSVLLGSSVVINFMLVGAMYLGFLLYYKKSFIRLCRLYESSVRSNLRQFSYKELTEATNGFEEELGRGSCGVVFKGETELGTVAVKILDRMFRDNDKEFRVEVNFIGQTHHKNLVRLIGYCDENNHRLLVFEFMSNGTLASYLFEGLKPSWNRRTLIAFGIARGLFYLHEECSTQIIHCDIKPQNVLLDEYYNARISDFGLAKLLGLDQSQSQAYCKTTIRGTKGYIAPDWFRSAPVSVKVDVYSFGVLLLEIVCCRRNLDEKGNLTDLAYECYKDGRVEALVENDMEALSDMKMVERFVMVAIWCLHEDPSVRPTMKNVMLMLEGIVQVSAPPCPYLSSSIT
ncbi:S-receptor-like serine/threonine-protein kinase [Parasponia andersonii]|uniref:Receptor-like serine/threonine-protein kinase n=1 Tax=Parasponia andersonii TaxID=3476 RepID=A0A2P5D8W7_PARAD|nr:S-receptor-like serine/threonine-protein kinase [Parasponia andersonii]